LLKSTRKINKKNQQEKSTRKINKKNQQEKSNLISF